MERFALTLSTLALTGLAGCAPYYEPPPPGPVTTTSGAPVVSAGATAPPPVAVAPVAVAPVAVAPAAPAPAAPIASYRPGFGIIESISLVTLPASAAAGGTMPTVAPGPYRLTLRMGDGSIQTLVADTRAFLVGDRVQIASDGRLIRP